MAFKMTGVENFGEGTPLFNKKGKKVTGENTSEIKKDKKGKDYALIIDDTKNFSRGDTIRPGNAPIIDNYIMGGDYETEKKGKKNYKIK